MMQGETRGMKGRVLSLACKAGKGVIGKPPLTLMLLGLVLAGSLPLAGGLALAQDPALEAARSTVQMANNQLGWGATLQTKVGGGSGFWVENVLREIPGQPGEPAVAGVVLVGIFDSNEEAVQDAREWTDQFDSVLPGTYYGYEALLYSMESPPMSGISWFCGRIWLDAFVLQPSEFPHSREQIVEQLHQAALANGLYNYCEPPGVETPSPTSTATVVMPTSTATLAVPTSTATPTATPVTPADMPSPTVTPTTGPLPTPTSTKAPTPTPTATEAWASACASGETNIGDASIFRRAKFTIGGTEPQEVRIGSPAENFAIVKENGGVVYQRIGGQGWGSLTLEPGTYILSCSGSGSLGLIRATVCIQYPVVAEGPTGPEEEGSPEVEHPPEPPGEIAKPSLPLGPIDRIIVRPSDDLEAGVLQMKIGQKQRFTAWGVDAAWREGADDHIMSITADDWDVSNPFIGSMDKEGIFTAEAEGDVRIIATWEEDMTAAFPVTISALKPITIEGKLDFLDEDGKEVYWPGGGLEIALIWGEPPDEVHLTTRTNPAGKFKFVVPYKAERTGYDVHLVSSIPAPAGFVWQADSKCYNRPPGTCPNQTNADQGSLWPGWGMEYLHEVRLVEQLTYIRGHLTHHGEPVQFAKVKLVGPDGRVVGPLDSFGRIVVPNSDADGNYHYPLPDLSAGRYKLTAEVKGSYVTLHNFLTNKQDIWVDLPITEPKTIDIEMISWADKVGYVPPEAE